VLKWHVKINFTDMQGIILAMALYKSVHTKQCFSLFFLLNFHVWTEREYVGRTVALFLELLTKKTEYFGLVILKYVYV
jgi:hypothetical protein